MTNAVLLRAKIDDSGLKMRFIASKIGIAYQDFLNKMNNKSEFRAGEIQSLCKLLGINKEEKEDVFFASL